MSNKVARTVAASLAIGLALGVAPALAGPEITFGGLFKKGGGGSTVTSARPWPDFLKRSQELERNGYRLIDLETYKSGSRRLFAGVYKKATFASAAYIGRPWKEFSAKSTELEKKGYRLIDIETWMAGRTRVWSGIYAPGSYGPRAWIGPWQAFLKKRHAFRRQGYRLIDYETYVDGKTRMHVGVFKPGKYETALRVGETWKNFKKNWDEFAKHGYRLVDIETYYAGNTRVYAGVYRKVKPSHAAWLGVKWKDFNAKRKELKRQGYHIVDLEVFAPKEQGSGKKPKPLYMAFSKNTKTDSVTGQKFPTDMPSIRWPKGFKGCSAGDKRQIKEAWALAHYYMWRSTQLMNYLKQNASRRKTMWVDGYDPSVANDRGGYRNHSPRAWFGPYNSRRFKDVHGAIDKVWHKRFRGKTFTVKCRVKPSNKGAHPCYLKDPSTGNRPSANHIVYGTINFCKSWFERDKFSRARTIVHEVFHWLKIPGSAYWVTDLHTHCDKGRCKTEKMYGRARASHLAHVSGFRDGHYKRATRNNDNYAIFIYMLGRRIYEGDVTRFPSKSFGW